MPDGSSKFMWCDGLMPESEERRDDSLVILGLAWIEGGVPGIKQQPYDSEWRFLMWLPESVKSTNVVSWKTLIPPENIHGWLRIDPNERLLEVDLSKMRE